MKAKTHNNTSKTLIVPNAELMRHVRQAINQGETAVINVKGYSMRPFLEHQRDKVKLAAPKNLRLGDAVLAEIGSDTFVLHRIIGINGDKITLMGDGNLKGTEHCLTKNVIATVCVYYHNGKAIPADDKKLFRRVRLWRKLLPARRWLLYIYRIKEKLRKNHYENKGRI